MDDNANRRQHDRIRCETPALIEYAGTGAEGTLIDVSPSGFAVSTGALVDEDQTVRVTFNPKGRGAEHAISADGRVLRTDNGRVAIRIEQMNDESTRRLRLWLAAHRTQ